jgi:hypothetical protein
VRLSADDSARLIVEYRNLDGEVLDTFDSGSITGTGWMPVPADAAATTLAPRSTRRLRVRLIGHHLGGGETAAQFDAIWLRSVRALTVSAGDGEIYEGDYGADILSMPVSLNCQTESPVRIDLTTAAGTAAAGSDFSDWGGTVEIPQGEVSTAVGVTTFGDLAIEGHETLFVQVLSIDPSDSVILDEQGEGRILGDDECTRGRGYWKTHEWLWPDPELQLGAVVYPNDFLLQLLDYGGSSANTKLAAELTAAKLNLGIGTSPLYESPPDQDYESFDVLEKVARADALLKLYPLGGGSRSGSVELPPEIEAEMLGLVTELAMYNDGGCG